MRHVDGFPRVSICPSNATYGNAEIHNAQRTTWPVIEMDICILNGVVLISGKKD